MLESVFHISNIFYHAIKKYIDDHVKFIIFSVHVLLRQEPAFDWTAVSGSSTLRTIKLCLILVILLLYILTLIYWWEVPVVIA